MSTVTEFAITNWCKYRKRNRQTLWVDCLYICWARYTFFFVSISIYVDFSLRLSSYDPKWLQMSRYSSILFIYLPTCNKRVFWTYIHRVINKKCLFSLSIFYDKQMWFLMLFKFYGKNTHFRDDINNISKRIVTIIYMFIMCKSETIRYYLFTYLIGLLN